MSKLRHLTIDEAQLLPPKQRFERVPLQSGRARWGSLENWNVLSGCEPLNWRGTCASQRLLDVPRDTDTADVALELVGRGSCNGEIEIPARDAIVHNFGTHPEI